jgi:O-antigen/teichoic acid export membrane protein
MGLQALAVGLPLAGFALAAPQIIPRLFGDEWTPALNVFPFVATGFLVAAVFGMHASILYVCRKNLQVTLANAVHVFLFAGAALLLVPRMGLRGYGLSELAAIGSTVVLHAWVTQLFPVSYRRVLPWFVAFLPPLYAPLVGWPWAAALALPAGFAFADRLARGQVLEAWSLIRRRAS